MFKSKKIEKQIKKPEGFLMKMELGTIPNTEIFVDDQ